MKRTLVLAVGSAAIVAAGLAGCSSDKSASDQAKDAMSSVTSAVTSATDAVKGNPEPGHAKMTVDGEEQDINGVAVCTPTGADMTIAIAGEDGGVSVVVAEDASKVTSVGLGTVDGVGLSVSPAGGDATASKDGKTYKVKGNAIGADLANPMAPVNKAFELAITCPDQPANDDGGSQPGAAVAVCGGQGPSRSSSGTCAALSRTRATSRSTHSARSISG